MTFFFLIIAKEWRLPNRFLPKTPVKSLQKKKAAGAFHSCTQLCRKMTHVQRPNQQQLLVLVPETLRALTTMTYYNMRQTVRLVRAFTRSMIFPIVLTTDSITEGG